jgi:hypothetical protein
MIAPRRLAGPVNGELPRPAVRILLGRVPSCQVPSGQKRYSGPSDHRVNGVVDRRHGRDLLNGAIDSHDVGDEFDLDDHPDVSGVATAARRGLHGNSPVNGHVSGSLGMDHVHAGSDAPILWLCCAGASVVARDRQRRAIVAPDRNGRASYGCARDAVAQPHFDGRRAGATDQARAVGAAVASCRHQRDRRDRPRKKCPHASMLSPAGATGQQLWRRSCMRTPFVRPSTHHSRGRTRRGTTRLRPGERHRSRRRRTVANW